MAKTAAQYRQEIIKGWEDGVLPDDEVLWHVKERIKQVKAEKAAKAAELA